MNSQYRSSKWVWKTTSIWAAQVFGDISDVGYLISISDILNVTKNVADISTTVDYRNTAEIEITWKCNWLTLEHLRRYCLNQSNSKLRFFCRDYNSILSFAQGYQVSLVHLPTYTKHYIQYMICQPFYLAHIMWLIFDF